jgi:hypothetical protein
MFETERPASREHRPPTPGATGEGLNAQSSIRLPPLAGTMAPGACRDLSPTLQIRQTPLGHGGKSPHAFGAADHESAYKQDQVGARARGSHV